MLNLLSKRFINSFSLICDYYTENRTIYNFKTGRKKPSDYYRVCLFCAKDRNPAFTIRICIAIRNLIAQRVEILNHSLGIRIDSFQN